MKIHLISVGTKMPSWVDEGYREYARRLPSSCSLVLKEIPSLFRGKNLDLQRTLGREGRKMLEAVPKGSHVIALDPQGERLSTEQLAERLQSWMLSGSNVALLVGGPEGLSPECKQRASQSWSLSPLTFSHPLVRVVVAESIYRAWSVMVNHPYHRG